MNEQFQPVVVYKIPDPRWPKVAIPVVIYKRVKDRVVRNANQ